MTALLAALNRIIARFVLASAAALDEPEAAERSAAAYVDATLAGLGVES
jgi:hypothetical protein